MGGDVEEVGAGGASLVQFGFQRVALPPQRLDPRGDPLLFGPE
jgi:hypothetical protein